MVKKCTEKCAACEEWLFCLSKPVAILEVLVAVAVVISQTPCQISAPKKTVNWELKVGFISAVNALIAKGHDYNQPHPQEGFLGKWLDGHKCMDHRQTHFWCPSQTKQEGIPLVSLLVVKKGNTLWLTSVLFLLQTGDRVSCVITGADNNDKDAVEKQLSADPSQWTQKKVCFIHVGNFFSRIERSG